MTTTHILTEYFPESFQDINVLKAENLHFKKLFHEFDVLEQEIYKTESGTEPSIGQDLKDMRMKRTHLIDQIYYMLCCN